MSNGIADLYYLEAISSARTLQQMCLIEQWRSNLLGGFEYSLDQVGYGVLSQNDEDGRIQFLLTAMAGREARETGVFVDIGAGDCVHHSNVSNLAIHFGWNGLFVDGNQAGLDFGSSFYTNCPKTWLQSLKFECAVVTPGNVVGIIQKHIPILSSVDVLSIDVDGPDYWIWKALTPVRPKIVVIETRISWGHVNAVVPYGKSTMEGGYYGASLLAMVNLGLRKGYKFVGTSAAGINAFFVRKDCMGSYLNWGDCYHAALDKFNSGFPAYGHLFESLAGKEFVEAEGVS